MGTLPLKKVVNADIGDSDHVGGNDWDDLADALNDVDKTGPIKINTNTEFRSGKLKIKDSDNSHAYTISAGNITSNRTANLPVLNAADTFGFLGVQQTWTGINSFTNYIDLVQMTEPATPASGTVRLFIDSTDSRIKIKKSDGSVVIID